MLVIIVSIDSTSFYNIDNNIINLNEPNNIVWNEICSHLNFSKMEVFDINVIYVAINDVVVKKLLFDCDGNLINDVEK